MFYISANAPCVQGPHMTCQSQRRFRRVLVPSIMNLIHNSTLIISWWNRNKVEREFDMTQLVKSIYTALLSLSRLSTHLSREGHTQYVAKYDFISYSIIRVSSSALEVPKLWSSLEVARQQQSISQILNSLLTWPPILCWACNGITIG
jgi:hypothetical protein